MEITKTFYAKNREEWRAWLQKHYQTTTEIWLVYYKKATHKPSVPYNEAVEEALCFGWIDSQEKSIDAERYAGRFTPRNPKTPYSESNKTRMRKLLAEGKVMSEVVEAVKSMEL